MDIGFQRASLTIQFSCFIRLFHNPPLSMSLAVFRSLRSLAQTRHHIPKPVFSTFAISQTMDPKTKQLYLADAPPNVVKLEIKPHFEALSDKQKRYAHHISRLLTRFPGLAASNGSQQANSFAGLHFSVPGLHCVKFLPNQNQYTI